MRVGDGPAKVVGLDDVGGVVGKEVLVLFFVIHVLILHDSGGGVDFLVKGKWDGWVRGEGLLMDPLE